MIGSMLVRPRRVRRVPSCFVLALVLFGSNVDAAHAQPDAAVTRRITVFTGGAFGGDASVTYGGVLGWSVNTNLDPTPIAGVRYEWAFLHYLAFGGQMRTLFWQPDNASRRNPLIDFSITPRVRFPIVFESRYMIEPYIMIPVGLSIGIWNKSVDLGMGSGLDRANPGLNLGAMAGVTFLTRSHVGAVVEFGWMHHVIYDSDVDNVRWLLKLNQATLHAGVTYAW